MKLAKTTKKVDDSKTFPVVQITYLEKVVDAVVAEGYGTHGSSPKNSPAILICLNGNEANRFIIPLSSLNRTKNLKEGEFETGNFKVGSIINFDENGNINITSKKNVVIEASQITANCDIIVTGGDVVADGVSLKNHTNKVGSLVGTKDAPGDVTISGSTGEPN